MATNRGRVAKTSVVIHAPADQVWAAFTDPEAIQRYMFGAHVVSEWTEGSPILWKGEWRGRVYEDKGVILNLEPRRLLRYSHFSPLSALPDAAENYHTVTVRLVPEGAVTRVSLTQDNNDTEEARAHSEANWKMMLGGLKALVEQ